MNEQPNFLIDLTAITFSDSDDAATRIPLAMIGTFHKGAQKFSITRKDVATMAANFAKRGNGEIVLDYEHASEMPEVAAGGPIPAAGWIVAVDAEPDSKGIVWGSVKLTAKARGLIASKEYKYISPVIHWGARDRSTGDPQGATLRSAALTNTPVLDRMPAITLSDAGWQAEFSSTGEKTAMAKEQVMCSEHPKTPLLCPTCDKDQIDSLAASEVDRRVKAATNQTPKVIRLSDVTRDAEGRLDMASITADAPVSMEVVRAFDSQRIALSELDAALLSGKIKPANKAHYMKLALSDVETFRAIVKDLQQVDLSERGHGGTGPGVGGNELETIDAKFDTDARARAAKDGIQYHEALKLVASENPVLNRKRLELTRKAVAAGSSTATGREE